MSDTAGTRSDAFVDQLLLEAGMDDDGRLRPALVELRALAETAPEPSAAIAALMAPAGTTEAAGPAAPVPAAPEESPRVDELAEREQLRPVVGGGGVGQGQRGHGQLQGVSR